MIVLDEQLLGRSLESAIAAWYRGTVVFITDLRPGTVIKDDAIPQLLRQQPQPTFVTINERDFWRKVEIDNRFCVVCFTLPDSRAGEIAPRLRALLSREAFSTKARRMGTVMRVTDWSINLYTASDRHIRQIE